MVKRSSIVKIHVRKREAVPEAVAVENVILEINGRRDIVTFEISSAVTAKAKVMVWLEKETPGIYMLPISIKVNGEEVVADTLYFYYDDYAEKTYDITFEREGEYEVVVETADYATPYVGRV